jgi:hypothetical protein
MKTMRNSRKRQAGTCCPNGGRAALACDAAVHDFPPYSSESVSETATAYRAADALTEWGVQEPDDDVRQA